MRKIEAKLKAGICIPLRQLEEHELEKIQTDNTWHRYVDPYECNRCPENGEKPANCGSCPNYEKHEFYRRAVLGGEPSIIIRKGALRSLKKYFKDELKVKDEQTTCKMSSKKFRFNYAMLNDGQRAAHDDLVKTISAGYSGILKSPARTGKTVMATAIIMTLNRRTIFIAHQEDLLIGKGQLISTFTDKTKPNAPVNPDKYFTNLRKFMDEGEEPIKYCRTLEDFLNTDICLTTYQVFLHPRGKEILKVIRNKFGLVVVDECFPEYVKVTLADGSQDTIKSVVQRYNSGEKLFVKSKNLITGVVENKPVISTNVKPAMETTLMRLHYEGGYIDCTANHPIWSNTRNAYIRADEIQEDEDVEILDSASLKE